MRSILHNRTVAFRLFAWSSRRLVAGLLVAIAMTSAASAQSTVTWYGSGTSAVGGTGTWNTTGTTNWSSNGSSWFAWNNTTNSTSTAVFAGTSGTVTLGTGITAGGLQFDTTGYTITASTLTLAGVAPQITVASTVTGSIASLISGTGGLTKAGDGTLVLANSTGNNNFTGGTTINAGVIRLVGTRTTLLSSGLVTINTGTLELAMDNYNSLGTSPPQPVTVNAGGVLGAANPTIKNAHNVGTLTLNGGRLESNSTTSDGLGNFILRDVNVGGSTQSTIASTSISIASGSFTVNDVTAGTDLLVSAVILGANARLIKTGAGTMELTGSNTYTAGTQINGGVLLLNNAQALSTSGTISFGGGTLQYSATNTADYSNRFSTAANQLYNVDTNGQSVTWATGLTSATGSLSKLSSGTLTLTGSSTFTGTTSIAAGMLQVGNSGTTGALADASPVSVSSGASLAFNRSNSLTYGGTVSGAGNFEKRGSGLLVISQNQSYTGTTTIASGTLQLGNGGTTGSFVGASPVINSGVLAFNRSDDLTYSGTVSGTGGLLKSGANVLSLAGANTYTGATTINGGVLSLGNANALGGGGNVVFTGGTLQFTSSNTADLSARLVNSSSAVTIDTNAQSVTFATALGSSNTGGLRKLGSGTLTLSAANASYTGGTTLDGGMLRITAYRALGSSAITINTGTLELALNGDNALGVPPIQDVTIHAGGALRGAATNAGATNLGTLRLNGGRLESNAVDASLGKFLLRDVVVGGSTQSEISAISVAIASGTFTVNDVTAGTDLLVSSKIIASSGGGPLVKSGSGTMLLTASNSYTAATTITGGRLEIAPTGRINSTSGITINGSGAELKYNSATALSRPITFTQGILSGTGTIATALTLGTNAIIAPGNSPGTQAYSAGLTWAPGGTYQWELNAMSGTPGTNWDLVDVTSGTFSLAGLSTTNTFLLDLITLAGGNVAGPLDSPYVPGSTYSFLIADFGGSTFTVPVGYSTAAGSDLTGLFSFNLGNWQGTAPAVNDISVKVNSLGTGIELVVVPEPSSLAIAGIGIAAVAWAVNRRRRAAA